MAWRNMDKNAETNGITKKNRSAFLQRQLHAQFESVVRGEGNYLFLENGQKIFDGSGGAAVACLGHGDPRVIHAMTKQMSKVTYCGSVFFTTEACEDLARELVNSTQGQMARAYIVNSGSEAMDAAMKIARQYYLEKQPPEPQRTHFIARNQSFHGTTLGALGVGGHVYRRAKFEPMLSQNTSRVSPCFPYRGKKQGETDAQYVERLAVELDEEFQRVGPERVCAFIAEPVVGAALGCVPAVAGYFKAMQAICKKYGALLIMDEIMSGMGRTGTHHAWQHEGVVPDLETIGKCLGGGYQPVAGVLLSNAVVDAFDKGTGAFVHGHTYQGHPVGCAAALAVQRIMREDGLIDNVREMGSLLGNLLHSRLDAHPNVGDIRGRGLFWGIEFVADKSRALPFPAQDNVAMRISEMSLAKDYEMTIYPGAGTADGINGDHIILSPAYIVTKDDVEHIVDTVSRLIEAFFSQHCAESGSSPGA